MRHPLRLAINSPLRKTIDHRTRLIGLQPALIVDQTKPSLGYQLLPSVKPRAGGMHAILLELARQIGEGYGILIWDVDRILTELAEIRLATIVQKPRLASETERAWSCIADADDEQIIDLRSFSRLPRGHVVNMVGIREQYTDEQLMARLRGVRNLAPYRRALKGDPRSEEFWSVLMRCLLDKEEAKEGSKFFQTWKNAGRPDPIYVSETAPCAGASLASDHWPIVDGGH